MRSVDISLIVPAYNEEENIAPFFERAAAAFADERRDCELIFVDDGSRDSTMPELRKLLALDQDVFAIKVVSFSRNFGKEAALLAGLERAEGDYIGFIDADLQQLPETMCEMIAVLDERPDVDCVAAYQVDRTRSFVLDGCSRLFYRLLGQSSGMDVPGDASDFRVFRRPVRDALLSTGEYYRFSKGLFSWIGFSTHLFPYKPEERFAGKTSWSFFGLVEYAVDGLLSFSTSPLRVATYAGSFLAFAAFLYFIVVLVQRIAWGVDVPGYATIVALILLLGGVQLLVLGIIGEYLARVYMEGKRRPCYIAKEVLEGGARNEGPVEEDEASA